MSGAAAAARAQRSSGPRSAQARRRSAGQALATRVGLEPSALRVARRVVHAVELAGVVGVARQHEGDVAAARAAQRLDRQVEARQARR